MAPSRAPAPFEVGTVLGGTYTIDRLIGRGGMGDVFAASHARLPGKQVAIKVLHAEVITPESMARFRREAEIASRLGHPNIVEVHDFNQLDDGTPYIVLEYLEGETLADRLQRGPMTIDETFAVVRQVGSALAAAHREGIVHRDLKPQNVFLVPIEDDGHVVVRAKVLDFGISKIRGSHTVQTQDNQVLGTPQYMSPEQAVGNHAAVDDRTDVFALGTMVYEMLAGSPAFSGTSTAEVVFKAVYEEPAPLGDRVPSLGKPLVDAVRRAMAKKPEDRFATVASFVEALTGAPLVTGRRQRVTAPPAGLAAASSPISDEATARPTSGIEGAAGPTARVTKQERLRRSSEPPHGPAGGTLTAQAPKSASRTRRGTFWLMAGLLLAGAAGVVVVVRAPGDNAIDAGGPIVTDHTLAIDAGGNTPTIDADVRASDVDATVIVDAAPVSPLELDAGAAAPKPSRPHRDRDRPTALPDAAPAEVAGVTLSKAEIKSLLGEARRALDASPQDAVQLASRVLLTDHYNIQALRIRVIAHCKLHDLGNAKTWLNRLPEKSDVRKQVLVACARAGQPLE